MGARFSHSFCAFTPASNASSISASSAWETSATNSSVAGLYNGNVDPDLAGTNWPYFSQRQTDRYLKVRTSLLMNKRVSIVFDIFDRTIEYLHK